MSPKLRHRILEDPNNTWNHQLMQACLQHKLEEVGNLLESGADPVAAREEVPFYSEPLPPLVALVLRGQYTPEALAMMDWLVDHGASVSAAIPLQGRQFLTEAGEEGTLVHLLVQSGQLGMLIEVLSLIAEPRPAPMSIVRRFFRGDNSSEGLLTPRGNRSSRSGSEIGKSPRRSGGRGRGGDSPARLAAGAGAGVGLMHSARTFTASTTFTLHLKGPCVDFEVRTSVSNLTVMDVALRRGDAQVVQLLNYYGCPTHFHRMVDGCMTPLARACVAGGREEAEALIEAGDVIGQISLDGRYTLIHYAAGQPAVLDMLCARGLNIDAENALGESALISLICYGQGMNADYSIREAPQNSDVARLAALPAAALQNYILTAMPPLVQGTGSRLGKTVSGAGNSGASTEIDFPAMEPKADAWWYFATTNTWAMMQNMVERGADVHGDHPRNERDKVMQRTDDNKHSVAYTNALAVITAEESAAKIIKGEVNATENKAVGMELNGNSNVKQAPVPNESVNKGQRRTARKKRSYEADSSDSKSSSTLDRNSGVDEKEIMDVQPNLRMLMRLTPLMHAIIAYHPELIRRLAVEYRADPMVCDAQGACALHYAALARSSTVIELLISSLVVPFHEHFDINAQDCRGQTPLHYAAAQGNVAIVRALLTLGPTIHLGKVDFTGITPLHLAVLANEPDVVDLLLRHSETLAAATSDAYSSSMAGGTGASGRRRGTGGGRRRGPRQSNVPVRDAPALEAMALVDVEAEDTVEGLTAVEMALRKTRHLKVARVLLSVGCASVRHGSGLPRGGNLLHRVVHDGSADLLSLLLEHYADPTDVDDDDHTPLHICAMLDLPQAPVMVHELVRYGALPDAQSSMTLETPILIAARLGRDELLRVLLYEHEEMTSDHFVSLSWTGDEERDRINGMHGATGDSASPGSQGNRGHQWRFSASDSNPLSPVEGALQNSRSNRERRPRGLWSSSSIGVTNSDAADGTTGEHTMTDSTRGKIASDVVLRNPQHLLLTDGRVRTPLHHLCAHSDISRQSALLPIVAHIVRCPLGSTLVLHLDAEGRTPLHEACAAGFSGATTEILNRDDAGIVFFLDSHGNLPLHDAVAADDAESIFAIAKSAALWVPCLLRGLSAIVDEPDVARSLPLTARLLQQQRHSGGGRALRGRAGREMSVGNVRELLNVPDGVGRTPLMLAAELGKRKAAAALVSLIKKGPHVMQSPEPTFTKFPLPIA